MGLFPKDRDLAAAPEKVELDVRASDFGLRVADVSFRLDTFLQHWLSWRSRTSLQRLIKDGHVLVDVPSPDAGAGTPVRELRPGRRLCHGSRVVVLIPETLRLPAMPWAGADLCVLFEDEHVLAVDKPPGLAVHPSGRHLTDTLIQRVHARYHELCDADGRLPVKLCHRLDRETSGVLLLGKDAWSHSHLMKDFENRRIGKEYLAIVHGLPASDSGVIDMPLGPARTSEVRLKMTPRADGMPSRTEWRVLERHRACALVLCLPRTGRQHQIRVHMEAIGHPLVGDKLYGVDEHTFLRHLDGDLERAELRSLGLPRHALHSHALEFMHPRTDERVRVESPLPADMRGYLDGAG